MSDNEAKALALIQEAEKTLNSSKSMLGRLFGGQSKEDALDCYARAGNLFKMAKKWNQAGETFVTLAQQHSKLGNKHDAATCFVDASNCYKKTDSKEAANCLLKAVDIYTDMGRFNIAAKHHQHVAEIYENDVADLDRAMQHYEQAADFFKVASSALESSLLKYSAKDYFFRAALCHLCVDSLNAQHALQKYEEQYPAFVDSREAKLIKALSQHLEDQDVDAFTEEVKAYDSISRLDQWYTTMLLRVKKQIPDGDELR